MNARGGEGPSGGGGDRRGGDRGGGGGDRRGGDRGELLIVNADDWGGFREGTDAIETCFAAGAISSSTAMVYMADSRRAAELARERRRPIGLHLNLTQPFDALQIPSSARERQLRLCAHFADLARRRWRLSPRLQIHRLVADGIRDQLEQFRELFASEPTHVDSHHHVHVCPDVFLSKALAPGSRVRQTLSPTPGLHVRMPAQLAQRAKHELLARRFITTARFWRAAELDDGDGAVALANAVAQARERPVEMMVHPSFRSELAVLRSDAWLAALGDAPLGSYAALGTRAPMP